jgi:tryptophan synthase alpha chain
VIFPKNRPALIAYVMGGDPDIEASERAAMACIEGGADILELGIPFTDPIADGPTIQAAAKRALASGTTLRKVLDLAARIHARAPEVPVVLMGYLNPVLAMGMDSYFEHCRNIGVSAFLCPDLPPDHLPANVPIDLPLMVAPTTTLERLDRIARAATGFIYYVSVTGTTGARRALSSDLVERLRFVRSRVTLPVVVGFGIHTAEQVRALAPHADGIAVGSAIVERSGDPPRVRDLVRTLRAAIGATDPRVSREC